jgi:truncated hemoglobin YjbI
MIDDLYNLIGGRQTVWAATESFYRRVLADESVSDFFKSTDMAHLHARQSMFISMLLGGRVVYQDLGDLKQPTAGSGGPAPKRYVDDSSCSALHVAA